MNLHVAKVTMVVLVVLGILGFIVPRASHAAAWFLFFAAGLLQLFIAFKTGEIVSTLGIGRCSFTYRRDETPVFFMWAMIVQGVLTRLCGFAFLFSL